LEGPRATPRLRRDAIGHDLENAVGGDVTVVREPFAEHELDRRGCGSCGSPSDGDSTGIRFDGGAHGAMGMVET